MKIFVRKDGGDGIVCNKREFTYADAGGDQGYQRKDWRAVSLPRLGALPTLLQVALQRVECDVCGKNIVRLTVAINSEQAKRAALEARIKEIP